ncbi:De-etiolated protein 1 Det1-domain-containing protein [Endogone sp. FLAS-F59071]|nr:De-etiolated protein 1 Det1-domain-containing protein [Endogone sp. FLAS-F59071]|eukprot:RUS17166.1 De-etiolated protein 1 Det1-domain-containing protein [Endogone sp. FLAS-F59071]
METRRRSATHGVFRSLWNRELGGAPPNTNFLTARQLYAHITPNLTIHNVDVPNNCVMRRFTPDGEYLIAFSRSQCAVQVYDFHGPACVERPASASVSASASASSLASAPATAADDDDRIKDTAAEEELTDKNGDTFARFFSIKYERTIAHGPGEQLCKEFCIVTSNKKYMILASCAPSTTTGEEVRRYPCSLTCIPALDDFTFYTVHIDTGKVADKRTFKADHISLSHHIGVSLYGSLFAVLSTQNQTIHIMQIKDTGQIVDVRCIGWLNHEDDELVLARHREAEDHYEQTLRSRSGLFLSSAGTRHSNSAGLRRKITMQSASAWYDNGPAAMDVDSDTESPGGSQGGQGFLVAPSVSGVAQQEAVDATYHQVPNVSVPQVARAPSVGLAGGAVAVQQAAGNTEESCAPLSGIKQRLMAYLFRKAYSTDDGGAALRHFYLTFVQFASLVIWKMQIIDESHLLLKFTNTDAVVSRQLTEAAQTAFFVLYNLTTTEVVAVYENASEEMLALYERHADELRGLPFDGQTPFTSCCSNSVHAREALRRQQHAVRHAKNGGQSSSVKRVLANLPFCPQSFHESPYLDQALFSYDEKMVSALDRPKQCQDTPIKFYLRSTGEMRFRINPNPQPAGRGSKGLKRFATFVPHPTLPFIISMQHTLMQPAAVNFHVMAAV